ncbi:wiskott-Aldrich syndrome protein homolog isoform X4 [Gallus gallus]|uniref:wiskott-Aldrich syndrome protein homolog isoform X4 n=1 Tax=Gallus gallus TaxID=9031 RepID=UPI001AE34B91|nr:wiskott-Aldrich syndrome protein homolog isoform X4 [Gallus gallus]
MPGRETERGPNPRAVPSAPLRTPPPRSAVGCGDLGRLKDSGPPPPQRCCPHPGRAPPSLQRCSRCPPGLRQEPGSGTAARLAALQLSWEVEDVAVKEEAQLFVQQQSSFLIAVALLHSPHP